MPSLVRYAVSPITLKDIAVDGETEHCEGRLVMLARGLVIDGFLMMEVIVVNEVKASTGLPTDGTDQCPAGVPIRPGRYL